MPGDGRFDPRKCGLWTSVAYDGEIKPGGWMNAEATGEVIGTCRACGGYLVPDSATTYGDTRELNWYVARCVTCGHDFAAPGGRVLRRSARASERINN